MQSVNDIQFYFELHHYKYMLIVCKKKTNA